MNFKKFLKQLTHYFPAQIAPALINLIIIMVLTRAFSVEKYGDYVLVTTIISFSVTVLTQWLLQSIMFYRPKYIKENKLEEFDAYLLQIINLFIIVIVLIFSVMLIVNSILDISFIYLIMLLVILAQSIFVLEQVLLQSDMKSLDYTKRVFLSNITRLLGVLLVMMFYRNIIAVLFVLFISYAIFILPKLDKYLIVEKKEDLNIFLKKMLTYGLPMLGWFLSVSIMNLGDRFLIKFFHGSEAVGLYSGNYSIISASLGLVFVPLTMVIHPLLMKYGAKVEEQKQIIEDLISKFTTIYFLVGAPIIVVVYILREEIAYVFLGRDYVQASDLIPIVMIGIFLWNLAMVGHKGMEIMKNTKIMFYFSIVTCITSFLFNIILVAKYSYIGAAFGNMIAFSLYTLLVYIYSKKNIRWNWKLKEIFLIGCLGLSVYLVFSNISSDQISILSKVYKICLTSVGIILFYAIGTLFLIKMKLINIKF